MLKQDKLWHFILEIVMTINIYGEKFMPKIVKNVIKASAVILVLCAAFIVILYFNNCFGVQKSKLETDIRSSQNIQADWTVEGDISNSMAAFISYPTDKTDHKFSVYVNRSGLSFGYFFVGGGSYSQIDAGIASYSVEGYEEKVYVSMNRQKVNSAQITDDNTIKTVEIDSAEPFAIVLPNADNIVFYDNDGNTVNYQECSLG